jgi:HEAT repeat protein
VRLLVAEDALAPQVGRIIAGLVRGMNPTQLCSLDEQVRHDSYAYYWATAWDKLEPATISRLVHVHELDATVIGLLASHPNGFVRAAALEVLAQHTSGQEIPFISIRANDWVEPVAARARELLISRLQPDNRHAVLTALPSILRVLGQRRREHGEIERALMSVLLSDEGVDALARGKEFDAPVRRKTYELMIRGATASKRQIVNAALKDPDPVIRARAVENAAADATFEDRAEILERFLREDRVPAVRTLTLALLAEHMPVRIAGLFPEVLLDRSASVRGLARFVARTQQVAVYLRTVYLDALVVNHPAHLGAAIEGIGETGTQADAGLIAPFLNASRPRVRRFALRALAKLDAERAISAAMAALSDEASSVRSAAVGVITANANRVDFGSVSRRVRSLPDPRARARLLRVFLAAPKWEAPVFLLESLGDPDDELRALAVRLVDRWLETFNRSQTQPTAQQLQQIAALLDSTASRLPQRTERLLRFSIKPGDRPRGVDRPKSAGDPGQTAIQRFLSILRKKW